jgi:hypothetical protein
MVSIMKSWEFAKPLGFHHLAGIDLGGVDQSQLEVTLAGPKPR